MPITPLPKPLPVNLATLKNLIDERIADIEVRNGNIIAEHEALVKDREEITVLQGVAKKLLSITPKDTDPANVKTDKEGKKYRLDVDGNKILIP